MKNLYIGSRANDFLCCKECVHGKEHVKNSWCEDNLCVMDSGTKNEKEVICECKEIENE